MAERINVSPEELRQVARAHRDTADELRTAGTHDAALMATLESLGPVFADLRDAGRDLLGQRRACYEQQALAHADLADQLIHAADVWCRHDAEAADDLRAVVEGGR
jgi:hypothetical protein